MEKPPPGPERAALAQQKLQRLREQFHRGLAARADEIEAAPTPQHLHAALHRLVGAAGVYGDTVLYERARPVLQATEPISLQTQRLKLQPGLAAQVQQLCALCRARAAVQGTVQGGIHGGVQVTTEVGP